MLFKAATQSISVDVNCPAFGLIRGEAMPVISQFVDLLAIRKYLPFPLK
jgi:hypothetical protein